MGAIRVEASTRGFDVLRASAAGRAGENGDVTTLNDLKIAHTQFIDAAGKAVGPLPKPADDPGELIPLYRAMVLTRRFDAKVVALQRTGRMGTYASSLGQEAVTVGLASAMAPEDVLIPSYREAGAQLWRGVTPEEILLYWGGDERGSDFAGPRDDFPVAIPVASQSLHATGAAYALKALGGGRVAVCVLGDGATSKGDFYEAINIAGAWRVPAVFVVNNNQWAISVPRQAQTAAPTLAQKAVAAGIEGEQVDGNDVVAVRHVVGRALAKARAGEGPSLIEALTYRLTDHTTADDAGRYRDAEAVSAEWQNEPIVRLRNYLAEAGAWSKKNEEQLIEEIDTRIETAVEIYEATPPLPPEAMFEHLYAELPRALAEQKARVARNGQSGGA